MGLRWRLHLNNVGFEQIIPDLTHQKLLLFACFQLEGFPQAALGLQRKLHAARITSVGGCRESFESCSLPRALYAQLPELITWKLQFRNPKAYVFLA